MVVTRKTPVAPVPTGSRTNSSQAVPRAAKPKSTSTLVEKETAQVPAKNAAAAASPKPHAKSKHKNRHHKKPTKSPSGWLDRLVYLSLSLLALYSFIICPRDSTLSNPICRSLSQYRVHVLEPYVLPPIYRTLAHPSVAPYVEKAQEIERTTARALRPAYEVSAPYVVATKRVVWDRTVVPAFYMYVAPQYRKHVLPQWRKHAAPHIARVTPYVVQAQHSLEHTAFVLRKTYSTRVSPAISQAYAFTEPYVIRGYRIARPHVVAFYVVTSDKLGAARRAYVDPHVIRMWEKVLELSGAGPVGSPTEQPPPVPEEEPVPTSATSEDSTTEQVASETSVEVTVTPVKASSSIAPSAEEEVPAPTATSSSVAAVETSVEASSVVPPAEASSAVPAAAPSVAQASSPETTSVAAEPEVPAAIIEGLSAASIAAQSAHGMESAVVEEILADVEASTSVASTPSATATTTAATEPEPEPSAAVAEELSAASIAVESAHGMESPVVQEILADVESSVAPSAIPTSISTDEPAVEEEEDDSDLLGFLDDIGLGDQFFDGADDSSMDSNIPLDADEDLELTPAEIHRLQQQEADEQAAAKVRYTAEKRAELEARMAESLEVLQTLAKESDKRLRKTLVGLRKSAVSKLDDPRTEVGGAVSNVRKEGDKMLAGLEGYLKKETAKASKGGDPEERAERWETVVKKVEEKLGESIQKAQGILHAFHAEEKAREVEDGMEIIKEVKTTCSQHQATIGLDLSWLNDVTAKDWKVYHSLAHIGDKFQAEASEIQAGTHKQPPVDPFIKRIEERQAELGALVNEFVGRISALREQAVKAFEPVQEAPPAPPAHDASEDLMEGRGAVAEPEDAPKEPEVSILPVPPAAEPGVVDPAQVIIGKSTEQVKEAMRIAEEHQEL